ncbi:hypothetical protein LTR35_017896 [Friedmanniomyces endolithicus]|uniref:Uncharacterized protein n=1 Tax=Friedmanniomyces endolithicus TaxID=329885 RepID=A0AAN6F319_9PEZI|nr:hypothetical protein LTR35_017896 [Friedmanniomyces endolithicus]KAK0266914.1 hypothetical protein LTS00_017910 [Friedmanniomyces endolithicus]KAK0302017.1 hypothetical protein LTR82_018028 [Friedmanniomyces endolithicus]KAK0969641.1 hypothetical protein LTR54_018076 [Friedmanniomyces endolithicus]
MDLEATYDEAAFKCRPRLALISLGQWLCQAYNFESSSSQRKVIDFAETLLGDLGYGVKVAQKKLIIDHTRCYAEATAIDAAMYIAHAHRYLGEEKLGLQ